MTIRIKKIRKMELGEKENESLINTDYNSENSQVQQEQNLERKITFIRK